MSALTWVQPPDLLVHELVASAAEGKVVGDVRRRWVEAGGPLDAPHAGLGQEGGPELRALANVLLDDLDARKPPPELARREPDDLVAIETTWARPPRRTMTDPGAVGGPPDGLEDRLLDRLLGAWLGRAAGCLLGKPVEKIPRAGIREILTSQGRWPLDDWFTARGLPDVVAARWPWNRRSAATSLAENIDGMPEDDDLNFALLALGVLERHGRDFTTDDIAAAWLAELPAGRVFTAERAAYRNLLLGETAPATALLRNPYREWIGAQIRADVYGWVNPGEPTEAARLAWRDARLSHVRNGVYGAMCVAAMCATAVVSDDVDAVLEAGESVVPPESRYAEALRCGAALGRSGLEAEEALDRLGARYGHLHWVHVLNNAALMAFALARSAGDFATGICLAVTGGWDTDSVGATVGSVCGGLAGAERLPERWVSPLRNRLATSLPGLDGVGFDDLAARTLRLAARPTDGAAVVTARGHDVTVLGSLNLDVVISLEAVPAAGETVLAAGQRRVPGGKGLNQAIAAARAGGATRMIGAVGDDEAAAVLLEAAGDAGVDVSSVRREGGPSGTAWVMVQADGDNGIVVDSGANGSVTELTGAERDVVGAGAVLVAQLETPLSAVAEAAAAGHAAGVTVVLNAAPARALSSDLLGDLLATVDVLVVNEHEARHLTGDGDPARAADALHRLGPAVVVTLGADGALVREADGEARVSGVLARVVDTTGAGDTFTGYLAAGLAAGASLAASVARAVVAGAVAVETSGAVPSIPTADQVRRRWDADWDTGETGGETRGGT